MKTLKTSPSRAMLRVPTVLLAAVAWLAVSNHCALAALEGSSAMIAAPTCHGMEHGKAPAKQEHEDEVECCKVLRATLPGLTKSLAPQNVSGFAITAYFIALSAAPEQHAPLRPLELDTGPPARISFAETVLQRSLLAHAPPALA